MRGDRLKVANDHCRRAINATQDSKTLEMRDRANREELKTRKYTTTRGRWISGAGQIRFSPPSRQIRLHHSNVIAFVDKNW